jgi:hypothetical protein
MRRSLPHERPKALRLLAIAAAVLLVSTAVSCGSPSGGTPSSPRAGTPSAPGAVSIPTGNLTAFDRCMLAAGYHIDAAYSAAPGENHVAWYSDTKGIDADEARARSSECEAMLPSPHINTEGEIREIYSRWVGEYHCLISLGYQPDSPPSVETFVASYYPTGSSHKSPWMPIDGVDVDHWTQAQYDEAKAKCTLEFFNNDTYGQ